MRAFERFLFAAGGFVRAGFSRFALARDRGFLCGERFGLRLARRRPAPLHSEAGYAALRAVAGSAAYVEAFDDRWPPRPADDREDDE